MSTVSGSSRIDSRRPSERCKISAGDKDSVGEGVFSAGGCGDVEPHALVSVSARATRDFSTIPQWNGRANQTCGIPGTWCVFRPEFTLLGHGNRPECFGASRMGACPCSCGNRPRQIATLNHSKYWTYILHVRPWLRKHRELYRGLILLARDRARDLGRSRLHYSAAVVALGAEAEGRLGPNLTK
jgi:hypothetical protein